MLGKRQENGEEIPGAAERPFRSSTSSSSSSSRSPCDARATVLLPLPLSFPLLRAFAHSLSPSQSLSRHFVLLLCHSRGRLFFRARERASENPLSRLSQRPLLSLSSHACDHDPSEDPSFSPRESRCRASLSSSSSPLFLLLLLLLSSSSSVSRSTLTHTHLPTPSAARYRPLSPD